MGNVLEEYLAARQEIVDLWNQGSTLAVTGEAEAIIEQMRETSATIEGIAEDVQGREQIPEQFSDVHGYLTQVVEHSNSAALLLTEAVADLDSGNQEGFQNKANRATTELESESEALDRLLEVAEEVME